jgi:hypothetical protein
MMAFMGAGGRSAHEKASVICLIEWQERRHSAFGHVLPVVLRFFPSTFTISSIPHLYSTIIQCVIAIETSAMAAVSDPRLPRAGRILFYGINLNRSEYKISIRVKHCWGWKCDAKTRKKIFRCPRCPRWWHRDCHRDDEDLRGKGCIYCDEKLVPMENWPPPLCKTSLCCWGT